MHDTARMMPPATSRLAGMARFAVAGVLGSLLALVALPALAFAADPPVSPEPSAAAAASPTPTPDPTPTPTATPTATPTPTPTPNPTPTPTPTPPPPPPPAAPKSMNLFIASKFRFQDPDWRACTAASTLVMLNFIADNDSGGDGFAWQSTTSLSIQDRILRWERRHDTLEGGNGSDPHGWRNALNYFGWGSGALEAGSPRLRATSRTARSTAR